MPLKRDELTPAPPSLFWYWCNERHLIYVRRFKQRHPKPWTADPILRKYKFTNVYRELDAGTITVRKVIREPGERAGLDLMAPNIATARMFNWGPTIEALGFMHEWKPAQVRKILHRRMDDGIQVFTNAHIIRSEVGRSKIDSVVDILTPIWKKRRELYARFRGAHSLEDAFNVFKGFQYIGDFMSYEFVTDLRRTSILRDATDIRTWANAGPGALRGLRRLYGREGTSNPLQAIRHLTREAPKNLGAHFKGFGPLEPREIEHSLCEFDKYCRVKFGEGKPRCNYPGE